jgi:hypothetical protein
MAEKDSRMSRKKPIEFPPGYLGEAARAEPKLERRRTLEMVLKHDSDFLDSQWLSQPRCHSCGGDGCPHCHNYGVAVN